jgi:hypothetical protein
VARYVVKTLNVHCNELRNLFHGWVGCLGVNGLGGGVFNQIYLVPGAEVDRAPSLAHAHCWVAYELFHTYFSSHVAKEVTC